MEGPFHVIVITCNEEMLSFLTEALQGVFAWELGYAIMSWQLNNGHQFLLTIPAVSCTGEDALHIVRDWSEREKVPFECWLVN